MVSVSLGDQCVYTNDGFDSVLQATYCTRQFRKTSHIFLTTFSRKCRTLRTEAKSWFSCTNLVCQRRWFWLHRDGGGGGTVAKPGHFLPNLQAIPFSLSPPSHSTLRFTCVASSPPPSPPSRLIKYACASIRYGRRKGGGTELPPCCDSGSTAAAAAAAAHMRRHSPCSLGKWLTVGGGRDGGGRRSSSPFLSKMQVLNSPSFGLCTVYLRPDHSHSI